MNCFQENKKSTSVDRKEGHGDVFQGKNKVQLSFKGQKNKNEKSKKCVVGCELRENRAETCRFSMFSNATHG